MNNTYLGIDIGGTAAKVGIVDSEGKILLTDSFSVCFDNYRTPIIETVMKHTDIFLEKNGIPPSSLSGIGVSATGQVNTIKGTIAGSAGHIDNWLGTPIKALLTKHYGLLVSVANDANCAVIGEQWMGAAKNCANVIMITIGTGVGGGIITNGQLLSGAIGIAGELGHFSIKKDGVPCTCGGRGCYECYASTTALVKKVREALPQTDPTEIDGKYIFQEIASGNALIQNVVNDWISDIAAGLSGLIHIFNPERVIIGGGISQQKELFIEPLRKSVYEQTMPGFRKNLVICAAELGNHAGLLGAAAYHMSVS